MSLLIKALEIERNLISYKIDLLFHLKRVIIVGKKLASFVRRCHGILLREWIISPLPYKGNEAMPASAPPASSART